MCKGIFGSIFGHNFKPRYSSRMRPEIAQEILKNNSMVTMLDKYYDTPRHWTEQIYEGDVCQRCGEVRNSPNV